MAACCYCAQPDGRRHRRLPLGHPRRRAPALLCRASLLVVGCRRRSARGSASATSAGPSGPSPTSSERCAMSDVVIRVEGLGKSYLIGHQRRAASATRRCATCWPRGAQRRLRRRATCCAAADRRRRPSRGILGAQGRLLRGPARRGRRHHRPQRRRQDRRCSRSSAASPSRPTGRVDDPRPRRQPAGGRHRLPPRADRPREHLPQRRHPRHDAAPRSSASSTRSSPSPRSRSSSTRRSSATRSGMYVRLAFAVAAHLEPEILVVDT